MLLVSVADSYCDVWTSYSSKGQYSDIITACYQLCHQQSW